MPAVSEVQRRKLNAKFGHAWVKKHHFDNKGKLPERVTPKPKASSADHWSKEYPNKKPKKRKATVAKKKAKKPMKSKGKTCKSCGKKPCKCKG